MAKWQENGNIEIIMAKWHQNLAKISKMAASASAIMASRQNGVNKRSGNQWRHQRAWHGGSMARKNENSVMASAWRNEK
jgi:hypothetical protein